MSENNLKIKVSAKEQNLAQNGDLVFDQQTFISDIYECEKQKYILKKRYNTITNSIKKKRNKPEYWNTSFAKHAEKEYKKRQASLKKPKPETFCFSNYLGFSAILGGATGVVLFILECIFHGVIDPYFSDSAQVIFDIFIALAITLIIPFKNMIKTRNRNTRALKKYEINYEKAVEVNSQIDEYNKTVDTKWNKKYNEFCNDIDKKADEYEKLVKPELDELKKKYNLVCDILNSLYGLRINGVLCLHPNYQGLVPISIIHGYFDTGRCTQLQGHEGAYNLYEDEKMKGMIISKLDIVSQQLGRLNNSMLYVGQTIEECNSRLADLESTSNRMINSVNNMSNNVTNQLNGASSKMSAIEENAANSAYYAEIGARMTTFNTVYNLLKD